LFLSENADLKDDLGTKLKFWAPVIFSVVNLQSPLGNCNFPCRLFFLNSGRRCQWAADC